ncbi:unnamed protein product [Boreogadus saida]
MLVSIAHGRQPENSGHNAASGPSLHALHAHESSPAPLHPHPHQQSSVKTLHQQQRRGAARRRSMEWVAHHHPGVQQHSRCARVRSLRQNTGLPRAQLPTPSPPSDSQQVPVPVITRPRGHVRAVDARWLRRAAMPRSPSSLDAPLTDVTAPEPAVVPRPLNTRTGQSPTWTSPSASRPRPLRATTLRGDRYASPPSP